jgi:hypothetical protein
LQKINSQLSKQELRRTLLKKRQSMTLLEWREKSDRLTTNIQNSVPANRIRGYTNKVRLRGLNKNKKFEPTHHLGFACVDAVSDRQFN